MKLQNHSLTAIAAMDIARGIGFEGHIPWHIIVELNHFRKTTSGHVVIMGSKTFESMNYTRLTNRENIVITRYPDMMRKIMMMKHLLDDGHLHFVDLQDLNSFLNRKKYEQKKKKLFLIGGGQLFSELLPSCDELILTTIFRKYETDCKFPEISTNEFILDKVLREANPLDRSTGEHVDISIDHYTRSKKLIG